MLTVTGGQKGRRRREAAAGRGRNLRGTCAEPARRLRATCAGGAQSAQARGAREAAACAALSNDAGAVSATHVDDQLELVRLVPPRKEGAALLVKGARPAAAAAFRREQLCEDAPCGPRVHRLVVIAVLQKQLRGTVPVRTK